ncbi:hypothetical protein [Pedobacter sp.]|jgi:hypothetical protein|uniref:hypothetical protein n=1 Tax=Pedobacter sp. TaxID=1411316 RepID=UPI0018EBC303|nr:MULTISPECIES: hypothetical protein [unclassified Pedobacter]HWW41542.1 hypothetical protein [Pedobacter sp.]
MIRNVNLQKELIKDVDEFSVLTRNALINAGIVKVPDLSFLHPKDLNVIKGIGAQGRKTVLDFCARKSIVFNTVSYLIKGKNWR